ncbi:hypothetical protein RFI_32491 [Reticulomyxa filosa]|uniref:Uncharacterized protein n=1 Tax=Reticulomyxa filosa TaxID=46433 RepID=X6LU83_RETFI|nr:hypothetical protein RFI_32491 [Reticulomyxa filosa]|eukprot:ETO04906.1 hypothetical protein RFI_32491 [Reticulomyxa filosa]
MDYISLEDMAAQLALILSELHVPTRARDLAEQFKNLLTVRQNIKTLDKVHHVLATENVGNKQIREYLIRTSPNYHQVIDYFEKKLYKLIILKLVSSMTMAIRYFFKSKMLTFVVLHKQ